MIVESPVIGRHCSRLALLAVALSILSGCGKPPPEVTPVSGVVTLGGAPVPNAYVQFLPQLDHIGAEYNSAATTDAEGKFSLVCAMKSQPGAAVCEHRVLISEAPASQEFRSLDGQAQANYSAYLRGLKNRPIPPKYSTALQTPLMVTVKKDQAEYPLTLDRN